ncbi:MAG: hypothetical protein AB7O86_14010 [Porticoccaceae bacterium]
MGDLTTSPDLARTIAELERRIRTLETASQLQRSSLTGGTITALNDSGDRVAEFGQLVGGNYGFAVNDALSAQTLLLVDDARGVSVPVIEHAWLKADDFTVVTSGAFTTLFRCHVSVPLAQVYSVTVVVTTAVATTGEVRLNIPGFGTTNAKTCPAAAQTDAVFAWDPGMALGLGSTPFDIEVQARRTSGAGNVNVYTPYPIRESSAYPAVAGGVS